jgi:glucoamylase
MDFSDDHAPGAPGIAPKWTSSAKSGVGTSLCPASRVWFTLSHGILNEIYYPRVDQACIRDLGLIVTAADGFFSEEKRDTTSEICAQAPGIPAFRLANRCRRGRYRIEKEVLSDPRRDVVLQRISFQPLQGAVRDYRIFLLLAPHLANHGADNCAWIGAYKGTPMLFAERDGKALALVASVPFLAASAGYVGSSDGWQDIHRHGSLTACYRRAGPGNVALVAQFDPVAAHAGLELALGFGANPAEAGQRALASLLEGVAAARETYGAEWQGWQQTLLPLASAAGEELYRTSMAVLRSHEAKAFPGGLIASLSIPWGFAKGDDDLGGYHLAWPRDLVEAAGGLLAAGAGADVLRVLRYLQSTQEADGHWPQNMWLDGTPYWSGLQLDETALPVLLVDLARREGVLDAVQLASFWPMVRKAVAFIMCSGPVTPQDRWEEDPGLAPFTLAAQVAALLVAAELAEACGETFADYLRETADFWNDSIERWTYVTDTDLARQYQVDGYYVRIAPPESCEAASPAFGFVPIKNRPPGANEEPAIHLISPDALALVRFGLRAADDPCMVNTCKIIDALLKAETDRGPAWHRYNDDGYGEHHDGSPFDGTGAGRAWPLLTGERAHFELAAGRNDRAGELLAAMESFAGTPGLLPEQVWDAPDLPERELHNGSPSGSAMPLVWAHAEYVKLLRSLRDGRVFDMPPQTVQRYQRQRVSVPFWPWRFNHKCRSMAAGKSLRIELPAPARIHWSGDGWQTVRDTETRDSGLGIHFADLPTCALPSGTAVDFTFFWSSERRWEGTDFRVTID